MTINCRSAKDKREFQTAVHYLKSDIMVADLCHVVLSCFRGEKRRHAKTRQMVTFVCFCMATFRLATQKYDTFMRRLFASCLSYLFLARQKVATRKPAKWWLSCFRMAKVHDIQCVAFSAVCRIFVWRGGRSPCENPTKSPFGGFSRSDLSRFRPENTFIRHGINKPPYDIVCETESWLKGIKLGHNQTKGAIKSS